MKTVKKRAISLLYRFFCGDLTFYSRIKITSFKKYMNNNDSYDLNLRYVDKLYIFYL